MPEISMCKNKTCPSTQSCYRYKAIPNENWQHYMEFYPSEETGKCNYFWDDAYFRKYDAKLITNEN